MAAQRPVNFSGRTPDYSPIVVELVCGLDVFHALFLRLDDRDIHGKTIFFAQSAFVTISGSEKKCGTRFCIVISKSKSLPFVLDRVALAPKSKREKRHCHMRVPYSVARSYCS
jgi:hypothetical protein